MGGNEAVGKPVKVPALISHYIQVKISTYIFILIQMKTKDAKGEGKACLRHCNSSFQPWMHLRKYNNLRD